MGESAKYWAAGSSDDVAGDVATRINQWFNYLRGSLKMDLWARCYRSHHAGGLDYGKVFTGGISGEQVLLKANHLRSINQSIVNAITAERPAFEAKAVNNDYDSAAQCILGQQILDYDVMRAKRLEAVTRDAVEYGQVYGEGFVLKLWDATGGEIVGKIPGSEQADEQGQPMPNTGKPQWSGTLEFSAKAPWDVVRDFSEDDPRLLQWYMIRSWANRHDLVALYPDKEADIMAAPGRLEAYAEHPIAAFNDIMVQKAWKYSDEIECWHFLHDQTDSLPHGRYMFLAGKNWIQDGPLPYRRVPVFRVSPGNQPGTCFGYTMNFDLQGPAHALNSQYTTIATNQAAFGIQSVAVPQGSNLTAKQIGTGMQMLEFSPIPGIEGGGAPFGLNLTKTAPETFTWLEHLVKDLQLISGVNSTMRGAPEENIKSGSMAALVVSQALTFTVNLQASYIEMLEDVATGAIEDYVDFAELPQIALIAGKGNAGYLKTFKGSDLAAINRVVVDVGNPLLKTIAGRLEVAQQLLANKMIQTPEQYIMVLTTGRLEPAIEGEQAELMNIKAENEQLAEGKMVPALATDMHPLHVRSHKSVVASPASRIPGPNGGQPASVAATLAHIQQHITLMKTTDPDLLQIIGVPPLRPPAPPAPEAQAAYEQEIATATGGGPGAIEAAHDVYKIAGPPQPGQPAGSGHVPGGPPSMPGMPSGPTNPLTHQKVPVHQPPAAATPAGVHAAKA